MAPKLKTQTCGACNGTGTLPSDDAGPLLKAEREKAGVQAKDIAEALNVSPSYLHDLERGNRRWTNELVESYMKALEKLRNGR